MPPNPPIKVVQDPKKPSLQASKWLQMQMLVDAKELEDLFLHLGEFNLFRIGSLMTLEELTVSKEEFLDLYEKYISSLKQGLLPDIPKFRRAFSIVLTSTSDALFSCQVGENQYLLKVAKPIIQLQAHAMHFSKDDHKFRPMIFGPDTITWGLQFSYPQLYQDPQTLTIEKANSKEECPNASLFQNIRKWQRDSTIPTAFLVEGEKVNIPIRIGKECLSWINRHPSLVDQQLSVL